MDIKSEKPVKTITVTDIDVRFPGETFSGTLLPADNMDENDHAIVLSFAGNGEQITINKDRLLYMSIRLRQVIVPEPDANGAAATAQ